jgi:LAS superfamily LD-carboxypeptidase LdcB
VSLAKLNVAFKQRFGDEVCLTDSYRTLSEQYQLRAIKPGLAAVPGTSEHGWGLAVDLCDGVQAGSGARFQWLRDNAPDYGWDNPAWARSGGSGPYEPWHWEFTEGVAASTPGQ